jgi:hypothetical protein
MTMRNFGLSLGLSMLAIAGATPAAPAADPEDYGSRPAAVSREAECLY